MTLVPGEQMSIEANWRLHQFAPLSARLGAGISFRPDRIVARRTFPVMCVGGRGLPVARFLKFSTYCPVAQSLGKFWPLNPYIVAYLSPAQGWTMKP